MSRTVAVMQPYFFPYGGYFSLMQSVDHFVLFDCVQFPRRGWVHRNRVPRPDNLGEEWITLPLASQPRETSIRDLAFAPDAQPELARRLARLRWLAVAEGEAAARIRSVLSGPLTTPVELLASTLRVCTELLGIGCEMSFSSTLNLDPSLKAQDRVIAAARAVGGVRYVNLSGGRELYAPADFERQGLELRFLETYRGSLWSLLFRFCREPLDDIRREIRQNALT